MVSYTQDWARLLYVGDVQFVITKRSYPFDHESVPDEFKKYGKIIYCIDIEFHLNEDEYPYILWCETIEDRDDKFTQISENELQLMLLEVLGYDLQG